VSQVRLKNMVFQVLLKYLSSYLCHIFILLGLYKGLSALLTFSVPKTAVRFGSNEYLKNNIFQVKLRLLTYLTVLF